jgi:hypothetical protein
MNEYILSEDLAVWFGKKKKKKGSSQPKGPWVNICKKKKGGGHPPCGRKDADKGAYPVCRAAGVAGKMTQAEKDSACRRKRKKEKEDPQSGKGQKPTRIKIKNYKNKKKNEAIDKLVNMIVESQNKKPIISEELQYHLDNKISISETIFRHGSPKYFDVINEARKLYKQGIGEWSEEDIEILESERGKFFIYKGERLPLDFPLVNEQGEDTYWATDEGKITLQDILELTKDIKIINFPTQKLANIVLNWDNNPEEIERISQVEVSSQYPILIMVDENGKILWILDGNHRAQKALISKSETIPAKLIKPSDLNPIAKKIFGLSEAEYKGKDVKLNKPKTGGPKKWYVYVRDPKTGNIKKVTYGSPVMTAKWNDPAARKSFAARHQCHKKKDKTKAGYWACRAHKDFGKNVSGRYW